MVQPADDLAFERIVNVPRRGVGDVACARCTKLRGAAACRCSAPRRDLVETAG